MSAHSTLGYCVNGRIKYVKMAMDVNMSTGYDGATWSIPATTSLDGWRSDGKIEVARSVMMKTYFVALNCRKC
jgi:hypothetical protein